MSELMRISQVIGIKSGAIDAYEKLHANAWPEVLATLSRCNIKNYSIYRYENLLFSYMEYVGKDLEADLALIAADPKTQEWWLLTDPMQNALPEKSETEWWHRLPEVFHMD